MIKTFKYIACCLVGVLALLPMQAQNIIRPKIAGPGNLWVNSYNGVLFFEQKDFETQNSAMPMQLCFYYNSSSSEVDYGYGLGFSMGFEMRYNEDAIGGVDIVSGDGRTDHFIKYGDEYKAPVGVFTTLTRPTFDTYLLTTKEGEKYFFDNASHHKVTSIEDRYGNKTTFKYQDTLLVEVKDAVGHTVTLSYTDGLLTQSSATFSPGKFKYEYDGLRRLRKRIDPLGNVTLYDYSRHNKLDEIIDANGNKTLIAYNDAGMVSRLKTDVSDKSIRYDGDKTVFIDYTEPNNVYSYYRWDEKGRVVEKVGICCGVQSSLKYDDNDNIAQRIDANGNATTFCYDEFGNILSIKDPLGNSEQFTYEPIFNQVASYRDKNGNSYSYSYDINGSLSSLNGPLGLNNRYIYDEHGWQTMITDSKGSVTRTNYNSDGTKSSIINPDGGVINYTYDSYGRMTTMTDALGNTTTYFYDNLGRVTAQTDPLGNTNVATYDKVGNLIRLLDAAGNITAYSYNSRGNITSIVNAIGEVTSYEYDERGNVIAAIDPLGIREEFSFNDRNKIISYTNGAGEKTNYDYDSNGNLIAVMKPNGNIISYDYDELNHLVEVNDNLGIIAVFEYDNNGNCISFIDGLNRKMTYTYDELNRRTSEIFPMGNKTLIEYDVTGNVISSTDALGHVTKYTYDVMGRLISHTDAINAKTQLFYDANGNLTKVIDANGNSTTYSYDALGQNTVTTFADGRSLKYTYDEIGHLLCYYDRNGNEFRYSFNPIGNLITKTYPDGATDNYTYDANQRLLSAVNENAIVTFTYDLAGRLTNESINGNKTTYDFDVATGIRNIVYPSGLKVTEVLNARNLISNIFKNGEEVISMSYNDANQQLSKSYSNSAITFYEYNENGWLTSIQDDGNQNLHISYDAVGNIIKIVDLLDPQRTESYGYDPISQLATFGQGSKTESWEYDLLGNCKRSIKNDQITTYRTNQVNSYVSITGGININPEYDGNGNMTSDGKHQYQYDYNNQLIAINDLGITYTYDALGRRITKGDTKYYYNGDQMVEEENTSGVTSYIYGNYIDDIILMNHINDDFYYHTNHQGSTMAITDKNNVLVERIQYNPFGYPYLFDEEGNEQNTSSINNNILYTGREFDFESKLYHYRNRVLHPQLGRFIQKDPLLYISGMNDLSYVNNKVVNYSDPFGLYTTSDPTVAARFGFPYEPPKKNPCSDNPQKDFCERHPYICGASGDIHGEVCAFAGPGLCFDGSISIDGDGIHIGFGGTAGVGFGASASWGAGGSMSKGDFNDTDVSLRANGGVKLGAELAGEYRYSLTDQTHTFTGNVGVVSGSVTGGNDHSGGSLGLDTGVGAAAFGGVHLGGTVFTWKPWK